MAAWPSHPVIYEVNTWVWLRELAWRLGRPLGLGDVPEATWDEIAPPGRRRRVAHGRVGAQPRAASAIAAAERRPRRRRSATRCPTSSPTTTSARRTASAATSSTRTSAVLTGWPPPAAPSPERGVRSLLDYVPNHVAPDHPWTTEHPERFIRGDADDLARDAGRVHRHRRQRARPRARPVLPAVARRRPARRLRRRPPPATIDTLVVDRRPVRRRALRHGDAAPERRVRPDVGEPHRPAAGAGLLARGHPGGEAAATPTCSSSPRPTGTSRACCTSRASTTGTTSGSTTASSTRTPASVRAHLWADPQYQAGAVRFLENHDEPRASATFGAKRAAGGGGRDRHPARRDAVARGAVRGAADAASRVPAPPPGRAGRRGARRVLPGTAGGDRRQRDAGGRWQQLETSGWPDNSSHEELLTWCWDGDERRHVVVVNLSDHPSQGVVHVPWLPRGSGPLAPQPRCSTTRTYTYDADDDATDGLFVDLGPWSWHVLEVTRRRERRSSFR